MKDFYLGPGTLVRDKVSHIQMGNGELFLTRSVKDDPAYHIDFLKRKLIEEAYQVAAEQSSINISNELADLLEVVRCIIKVGGLDAEYIDKYQTAKAESKGSFLEGHINVRERIDE